MDLERIIMPKRARGKRGPLGLPPPPDPERIKEDLEGIINGASTLSEIPQSLISIVEEVDEGFRRADRTLRGARIRGRGRRK